MPGFQRDQAYISAFPFEHIDTESGNLLLTFTDFALPGYNGMDLVFQRTFNSANQNWVFGLAGIPMRVRRVDGPGGSPPDFENPDGLPLILTSDGGAHRTWWEGGDYNSPSPVFRTAEFWRYHVDGRRLELPNGVECYYDDRGYLREVRDRFSNRLEIENETYAGGSDGRRSQADFTGGGPSAVKLTWPSGHGYIGVMKSIAAGKFKDICLKTLDEVASTKSTVVITKRGRPVAKLVPYVGPLKKTGLAGSVLKEVGDPFGTGEGWDADADADAS